MGCSFGLYWLIDRMIDLGMNSRCQFEVFSRSVSASRKFDVVDRLGLCVLCDCVVGFEVWVIGCFRCFCWFNCAA